MSKLPEPSSIVRLWNSTLGSPEWSPTLVRCGSYNEDLKAFPVESNEDGRHLLWIPRESKFGLRLMNHVIYCLWHTSRVPALPSGVRLLAARLGEFTDRHLRSGFFKETLTYWYLPDTQLPTQEEPITRSQPFYSKYLTYFLAMMYVHESLHPARGVDRIRRELSKSDPLQFDWEAWAQRRVANQILFGAFPSKETELYKRQREENLKAGIPDAPSTEIDLDSWCRYASVIREEYLRDGRYHSGRLRHQPNLEAHHGNPTVGQPSSETLGVDTMRSLGSLDTEPDSYALRLNRTQLLFIPPFDVTRDPAAGTVVQVRVRGDLGDGDISDAYIAEQTLLTTIIETLLVGHVNAVHGLPERVVIKEVTPGYNMVGTRKPWEYGRGKKFCLGDAMLQPAKDKWDFHFEKRM